MINLCFQFSLSPLLVHKSIGVRMTTVEGREGRVQFTLQEAAVQWMLTVPEVTSVKCNYFSIQSTHSQLEWGVLLKEDPNLPTSSIGFSAACTGPTAQAWMDWKGLCC